jgi:hypothetical protein
MFLYFTDSMRADYAREPRPDPPALLQAVASARDRRGAPSRVMGGSSFLPVDERALTECGAFVPRSFLVAGREYGEFDGLENLSEERRQYLERGTYTPIGPTQRL